MRDHAGVYLPPPMLYVAMFLVGLGLQRVVPVPLVPGGVRPLAPLLVVAAVVLIAPSFAQFWRAHTSVIPVRPTTALVVEGPYRFSRNPMYVGLLLLYIGVAFWSRALWPLLLIPLLIWIVRRQVIDREERYLLEKFGDEYRAYQQRVRRWI